MATDPQFKANREKISKENGMTVWGSIDPSGRHSIHGAHVTVDFNICLADRARLEDHSVDVFAWVDTPEHPESDIKVELIHEDQCIDCMFCVGICPVDAIDVDPGQAGRI